IEKPEQAEEVDTPRTKVTAKKKLSAYEQAIALRTEGKYEEAVAAFVEASKITTGLERERCLYQAASLSLSKLNNSQKAALLSQSYTAQYPKGFYTQDAYILQARAHMKGKEFEKARAVLMNYIDSYPHGSQQELAHLLLGKIFATTYSNCKAAVPHLEFVVADKPTGARAKQAQKILDYCKKKNP
ncbi:MAG: outer membrane protein assembly factor BamD, partial [Deltaproteobacteria bacterium]|nr:outer membrane protein assembly factor BamD [Deltaproteobacteria bacterium]